MNAMEAERMKSALDRYMERNAGLIISAVQVSNEITGDIIDAEDQLRIFVERHEADCTVIGKNPLRVRYTMPFLRIPEQRIIRERRSDQWRRYH
jgi:hypothetical protein